MKQQSSAIEQALMNHRGGAQNAQTQPERNPLLGAESGINPPAGAAGMPGMAQGTGFDDIRDEIVRLIREGKLPVEFDLQSACADDAFAALLAQLPTDAAVRVYAAEKRAAEAEQNAMQRVSTQVKSRNALPRSTRGGAMSAPALNYRDMDSATFRKLLGEIKKTTRNGGKVRL